MRFQFLRERILLAIVIAVAVIGALASTVRAIGWGPTDFLVFGAPNGPDRIGDFDQNFSFKGYLLTDWFGAQGMNFDQQGRLVVFNTLAREVRAYDSSGAQVGGFDSTTSPMLTNGGDVQIMADGNYLVGTSANGARLFTPQGTFLRQYGTGDYSSIALLPDHKLWAGNLNRLTMDVLDTDSGDQIGSFALDGETKPSYMQYSAATNTVLVIDRDRDAGGVFERDLTGALLQQFNLSVAQVTINGATRGPAGDVFGTAGISTQNLVRWRGDGSVIGTQHIFPAGVTPTRIVWAGVVPEPGSAVFLTSATLVLLGARIGHASTQKTYGL